MTRLSCPCCPRARGAGHYLCQYCWGLLTPTTRRRLSIRDARAFARLRQLHGQIAEHRALHEIEVDR
ncbi:hypothetical protein G3M58_36850 [Streptomyces sp. SID7499]|uniref:Uncharacterized protein n=1 Tax=Streptomyces sp. SID7499 TaxID=2706086 RepID=A0A6G3X2V0_9ACTN|nr:hypothetical protein [Streptomyces sp. SID7499]